MGAMDLKRWLSHISLMDIFISAIELGNDAIFPCRSTVWLPGSQKGSQFSLKANCMAAMELRRSAVWLPRSEGQLYC